MKATISEEEFVRLCDGIYDDRESIWKHNPIGTNEEILLWMLLGVLVSYLNLSELETPCFTGKVTAETYRTAILEVLRTRAIRKFDSESYLDKLVR